jgi:hypothetical protein
MTSYDSVTFDPLLDTLMQTQYTLFAAALFIGCMIFDVQFGANDAKAPTPTVAAAPHHAASARDPHPVAGATPVQLHACLRGTDAAAGPVLTQ